MKKIYNRTMFQQTYAKMPEVGESHLNLMNTLEFPIIAKINQAGSNQTFELDSSSNHVLYNLQAGQEYYLAVQILNKSNFSNDEIVLKFNATNMHVS